MGAASISTAVTMPTFAPAPRTAQNSSASSVAETIRTTPSAVTISAARIRSIVSP